MFILKFSISCVLFLVLSLNSIYSQPRLLVPVEGTYGKDYYIFNYIDWGQGNSLRDYNCGKRTYHNHQGTDFGIRDFAAMDSGVNVVAAADGLVVLAEDGMFDRETTAETPGMGNYVAIEHSDGYRTHYGHLRKNSIKVKTGDQVKQGQVIAQIGSSGNSTGPHVHFELTDNSGRSIDPFKGSCGRDRSLWLEEPPYHIPFALEKAALCNFNPTISQINRGISSQDTFTSSDKMILFCGILYGLQKGDKWKVEWYTPSGDLWFAYGTPALKSDLWTNYISPYTTLSSHAPQGKWNVKFYKNDELVESREFYFKH